MSKAKITRRQATPAHTKRKILFVVSNPAEVKGVPVGFFAEELTRPFFDFIQAGYEIDIASPKGGATAFDSWSDPEDPMTQAPNDLITIGFKHHEVFSGLPADTKAIKNVDPRQYDAVCVVGGGAPMITFKDNEPLHALVADFYEADKVVGMICHGSSLLLWTRLSNGALLADGKTWTGFSDSEEQMVNENFGMTVYDYTIESEAQKNPKTSFESAEPMTPFAIRDGRLITAQQQHSSGLFSELVMEALD